MTGRWRGVLVGLLLVTPAMAAFPRSHLTLNIGQSLSGVLYACHPVGQHEPLPRGTVVYYSPPVRVQAVLERIAPGADGGRGWLKQVGATEGDVVCWKDEHLLVNQERVGVFALVHRYALTVPRGTCQILGPGEVLPLGTHDGSFDGRYTGPLTRKELTDVCIALF